MNEMDRMQADAVSRAKDMYRRSQNHQGYNVSSLPNGYNGNMRESKKLQPNENAKSEKGTKEVISEIAEDAAKEAVTDSIVETISPQNENNAPLADIGGDFLDQLLGDKEKTLIVLLIALLSEEKASTSLMLALMYLIM